MEAEPGSTPAGRGSQPEAPHWASPPPPVCSERSEHLVLLAKSASRGALGRISGVGLPALSCMTASSPPENSRRRSANQLSPTSWFPSTSLAEKS